MLKKLGWANDSWGSFHDLKIPINDRGLNYGDGIFETIFIYNNKPQLLTAHINRWHKSAAILGMELPPKKDALEKIITEIISKKLLENGTGALRVNWSRGSNNNRGITIDSDNKCRFWAELTSLEPSFKIITALISSQERRNANSLVSQCKSFNYLQSIQAQRLARKEGFDEALLLSTSGEMCCSSTANIIVKRKGKLLTPRIASGCLPGIMREQALKKKLVEEAELSMHPESGDEWLLINSLSCNPIHKIGAIDLTIFKDAQHFWEELLIE